MASERAARLAEVEKLSRKPHQELHANLLDVVLGAFDKLSPEEWIALARRSPDRLIQALSMSGKLAGFSEKSEVVVSGLSGLAAEIERLSDAELEGLAIARATTSLDRLAAALPQLGRVIEALTPTERQIAITAIWREPRPFDQPAA
jgi:hypothetical protein